MPEPEPEPEAATPEPEPVERMVCPPPHSSLTSPHSFAPTQPRLFSIYSSQYGLNMPELGLIGGAATYPRGSDRGAHCAGVHGVLRPVRRRGAPAAHNAVRPWDVQYDDFIIVQHRTLYRCQYTQ